MKINHLTRHFSIFPDSQSHFPPIRLTQIARHFLRLLSTLKKVLNITYTQHPLHPTFAFARFVVIAVLLLEYIPNITRPLYMATFIPSLRFLYIFFVFTWTEESSKKNVRYMMKERQTKRVFLFHSLLLQFRVTFLLC